MDSITHALLGTTIAEAAFREKLGGRALVVGAVLGVLPDLDIFTRLAGPWEGLKYHRGPTHSLIVLALVSPVIGWLFWLWTRKQGRHTHREQASLWSWICLTFLALFQNPLLDLLTSYGTQLFWPVTTRRFAIDAVGIIDPLYTLPLLVAVVVACVPGIRRISRTFAACVLVLTTGYLGFGFLEMERARSLASAQVQREHFPARLVRATPMLLTNNLVWRVIASDEHGNLRVGFVSTWKPREIRFHALDRPTNPLVQEALQSENGRIFQWFADGLVSAHVQREGTGIAVILEDQRYGTVTDPTTSFFAAAALFDASGRLSGVHLIHSSRAIHFREELSAAWKLLRGEETESPK